jgi:putative acetyltransferase
MTEKNVANIIFRRADNGDSGKVRDLVFNILKEYGLSPDPLGTDSDLEDIEKHYFERGGYFEVLEISGELTGSWGLYPLENKTAELRKMYLSSEYRGKGLGGKIMNRVFEKCRGLGFNVLVLETASPLKEAIALYGKLGFKKYYKEEVSSRCDQTYYLKLGEQNDY